VDAKRIVKSINRWTTGQPLEHGTVMGTFFTKPPWEPRPLRSRTDARIGYASGEIGAPRVSYADTTERLRELVTSAMALITSATA
jgi:hypothetical protein